jgi:hypothetical protein
MVRALVTLLGLVGAAALLYGAPEADDAVGGGNWSVVGAWALAGFVAGLAYQAGGIRRPGVRVNLALLLLAALPWGLLTAGLAAVAIDPDSTVAEWTRDIVPVEALTRWVPAVAAFALAGGLLLALALLEPRVGDRARADVGTLAEGPAPVAAAPAPVSYGGATGPLAADPLATPTGEESWEPDARDRVVRRPDPAVTPTDAGRPRGVVVGESETRVLRPGATSDEAATRVMRPGGIESEGETRVIRPPDDTAGGDTAVRRPGE